MYRYTLFGMNVESDLEFTYLVPSTEELEKTIYIREGICPDKFKNLEKKYGGFGEPESWLQNTQLYLYITNGDTIVYEPKEGADMKKVRSFILGWGMSMCALQRGEMAMHNSVVADEKGAYLICGESGTGKSTVTAAFLDRGYRLVADDMALAEVREDGKAYIKPAFPFQKLCTDVAVARGLNLDELIFIDEIKGKYYVKYPGEFDTKPVEIKGMIWLRLINEEEVATISLEGIDRFHAIVNNLFLRHLLGPQKYSPKVGMPCLKLAGAIPVKVIGRPAEGDTLQNILRAAFAFVESL